MARRSASLVAALLLALVAPSAAQTTPSPAISPAPTYSAGPASDPRDVELLRAAIEAQRNVSYVGQVESVRWGEQRATNATVYRVEHRAPNLTRRTFLAPQALYGDIVMSKGGEAWEIDVKRSRVITSHNPVLDDTGLPVDFNLIVANYRAVESPHETYAGRDVIPLTLVNRFTGERVMRLRIDAQTKLILAKDTYHANGALAAQMRFDAIRYTNDLPATLFNREIPAGYAVVNGHDTASPSTDFSKTIAAAGFSAQSPHYLPEGFQTVSADVSVVKGVKTLHLLYSDGIRTLSLFENATGATADFGSTMHPQPTRVEQHDAVYVADGPTTLLAWREAKLFFALVGDLDVGELRAIAASVVP